MATTQTKTVKFCLKKLSDELRKEHKNNLVNSSKITISYNNLTHIGTDIPSLFHNITKLYLSNNRIATLSGMEVFVNLTHLSICFNNLERLEELDKIRIPKLLVSLSVKGNMFCKNPVANIHIIERFKNLKDLDGYKISEQTYKTLEGRYFDYYRQ
jgi:Leucine-rich repeat (LRR) protein